MAPLDIIKWLENFKESEVQTAIHIAMNMTVFDTYEIEELKILLGTYSGNKNKMISTADIDYSLILN